jgi:hypothetical protein
VYLRQLFVPEPVSLELANAVGIDCVAEVNRDGKYVRRDEARKVDQLKTVFHRVLNAHFNELVKANATVFQQDKLLAAVKAYWKVTRKRVSDTIMQCIRDVVIEGWRSFLLRLPGKGDVMAACAESNANRKRRAKVLALIQSMDECFKLTQDL